jgi:hypothetical protein
VTVSGASILRADGALLRLRNRRGARAVTVAVAPLQPA